MHQSYQVQESATSLGMDARAIPAIEYGTLEFSSHLTPGVDTYKTSLRCVPVEATCECKQLVRLPS
jgi:hypothetical protein